MQQIGTRTDFGRDVRDAIDLELELYAREYSRQTRHEEVDGQITKRGR